MPRARVLAQPLHRVTKLAHIGVMRTLRTSTRGQCRTVGSSDVRWQPPTDIDRLGPQGATRVLDIFPGLVPGCRLRRRLLGTQSRIQSLGACL